MMATPAGRQRRIRACPDNSARTVRVEKRYDVRAPSRYSLPGEDQVAGRHMLRVLQGAEGRIDLRVGGHAARMGRIADGLDGGGRRVVFGVHAQDRYLDLSSRITQR